MFYIPSILSSLSLSAMTNVNGTSILVLMKRQGFTCFGLCVCGRGRGGLWSRNEQPSLAPQTAL